MILLDTSAVIGLIHSVSLQTRRHYADAIARGEAIGVSSVVVFELRYGVAKSRLRRRNASVLDRFLSGGPTVIPFDADDAATAGDIRATLERAGTPIGHYALLIAGQALRHGATVVTANVREFERVAGLRVEDWTRA